VDLKIIWSENEEHIFLPEENLLGILHPPQITPEEIDLQPLVAATTEFLKNHHRILVLINDYTRPTPNQPILQPLLPLLLARDTKFLIGLGTHRPATPTELKNIFGTAVFDSIQNRIIQHNARDPAQLFFLGRTSFGTDVWFNRTVLWAEAIVTINSIEPHYFAGYTGGRKSFIPGIARYETIIQNHNLLLHPASAPLSLKDNPVHEDMTESVRMLDKPMFSIQIVQNQEHNIISLHYGDIFQSFQDACTRAYPLFATPIKEKADIVLSILLPPYDINFYQSQRALEFALSALKPGGIHITVSRCRQGVGNDEFIHVLSSVSHPERLLQKEKADHPGWHKAARLARAMQKVKLYTVMGIDDRLVKSVFMEPFHSIQEAIDHALRALGKEAKLYLIPDAGAVVPLLTNRKTTV